MNQPPNFVDQLLAHATLRQFVRKELVIEWANPHPGLHFLLRGAVDVWVPRLTGELVPIHLVSPLSWFGELGSMTGNGCCAEYTARTKIKTLFIPRSVISFLGSDCEGFRGSLLELLSQSVRSLMEMVGELAGLDTERRVISKLISLSVSELGDGDIQEQVIPLTQAELAAMSCVSRSTISLTLAKLERAGILSVGYRRITLHNRKRLISALRDDQ